MLNFIAFIICAIAAILNGCVNNIWWVIADSIVALLNLWLSIKWLATKMNVIKTITRSKYYYCVNTVSKNDTPVQRSGYVEARNERKAIQKLIDTGVVCASSYEFLELVKTTDWLIKGVIEEQLQREKEEALN